MHKHALYRDSHVHTRAVVMRTSPAKLLICVLICVLMCVLTCAYTRSRHARKHGKAPSTTGVMGSGFRG